MKEHNVCLLCLALIVGLAVPCFAGLYVIEADGEKVVHDDTNRIYWVHDLGLFSNQTFAEVLATIEQLNTDSYFDRDDWHLASRSEIDLIWAYGPDAIESVFLPAGPRAGTDEYRWEGRYDELYQGSSGSHSLMATTLTGRTFGPGFGAYADWVARPELSAWVAAVPEPTTLLLLGLGVVVVKKRRICC